VVINGDFDVTQQILTKYRGKIPASTLANALSWSAYYGYKDILMALLQAGANPDYVIKWLHYRRKGCHKKIEMGGTKNTVRYFDRALELMRH